MANPYALPTLKQLRDAIKLEGRLAGTTDNDPLVNNTINELLVEYCTNNRYFELLNLNSPILTTVGNGLYSLPNDFHHISNVRYQDAQGGKSTLYPRKTNLYLSNPAGTRPRYYEITGQAAVNPQINIMPFDGVDDAETILIDYYSLPPNLSGDDDVFPIIRLVGPIKQKAIYRMLLYNNQVPSAAAFKTDSTENEARAKPSG